MYQATEQPVHSPLYAKWGCLALGCGVPTLMILLVCALMLAYVAGTGRKIDREVEQLRAAGQPVSAAELEQMYVVPADKTDVTPTLLLVFRTLESPAYQSAARPLPIVGDGEPKAPPPDETWQHDEAVAAFLKQHSAALKLLHVAARDDAAARFPIDFAAGLDPPLAHLTAMRAASRLLALEFNWKAYHEDAAGAADSLHALFCLARVLEREPFLGSLSWHMAIEGIPRIEIGRWLPRIEFSDSDLARLQADLRAARCESHLERVLICQRVAGKDAFAGTKPWQQQRREDYLLYLQYLDRLQESLQQPWPRPLKEMKQVDGHWRNHLRTDWAQDQILELLVYIRAAAHWQALSTAAETALAAERFRRRNGRLPESLQELVPEWLPHLPLDPYTGDALRMRPSEQGLVIYSVGLNGTDDGGLDRDDTGQPDVTFELRQRQSP